MYNVHIMYPTLPEHDRISLHLHQLPGCQDLVVALANHCGRPSLGSCGPAVHVMFQVFQQPPGLTGSGVRLELAPT